jgi:hypothetical protein
MGTYGFQQSVEFKPPSPINMTFQTIDYVSEISEHVEFDLNPSAEGQSRFSRK